jgi:hypothetical protein
VLVEGLCILVLCVSKQRIGPDMGPGLQATIDGETYEKCAQAISSAFKVAGKAAHSKTGNWVTGQLFPLGVTELFDTDLCGALPVETQNFTGRCAVGQYKN